MRIFAPLLFLLFFFAAFELNAAEIEPAANKFEAGVLKKAASIEDLSQRAQVIFDALNDERAGAPLLFNAANAAVQISEKSRAKELFLASIKKMPNFYMAHRNLAYLLLEENDFEGAIKEFGVALSLSNADFQKICQGLGYCHFSMGSYSQALLCFENALLFAPKDLKLLKSKARCLSEIGDYARLENTLNDILKISKTDADAWRMLAFLRLKNGDKYGACAAVEAMKSLSLSEEKDSVLLGDVYADLNMFSPAAAAYSSAKIPEEKAYEIARFFALSNHVEEAEKIALNIGKSSWRYFEIMGILSEAKGESAKEFFEKSHAKNPLNPFVCLKLADIALAEGNLESARTFYGAAKSKHKRQAVAGLANVAIASGDFSAAADLLEGLKREFKTDDFDEFILKLRNAK